MRSTLMGGASLFAHLSGIGAGRRGARAEDDDQRDDKDAKRSKAEDDDDDKDARAEDDDDKDQPQGKRSKAEDDDDDKDARAEDDDEEDEPKSRRSKAEDDDDDKDEMNGKSAAASARKRERARCSAIFASSYAADNVALAASLAFETSMTRKEAIAVLKSQAGRSASAAHDVRSDRSARNPRLGPGGESSNSGHQAAASSWDRALVKAGVAGRAK